MIKLGSVSRKGETIGYVFNCPGCQDVHQIDKRWTFNGDVERPTFNPSLHSRIPSPEGERVCHSYIRDGQIQFLGDCTHGLAGQTVEIPGWKGWGK